MSWYKTPQHSRYSTCQIIYHAECQGSLHQDKVQLLLQGQARELIQLRLFAGSQAGKILCDVGIRVVEEPHAVTPI